MKSYHRFRVKSYFSGGVGGWLEIRWVLCQVTGGGVVLNYYSNLQVVDVVVSYW